MSVRSIADKLSMRVLMLSILACAGFAVSAADKPPSRVPKPAPATFVNLHSHDKGLLGIRVQQYPDCRRERSRYVRKHPCMIVYVFNDGRAHQTSFSPGGKPEEDFWWSSARPQDSAMEGLGCWYGNPSGTSQMRRLPQRYQTKRIIKYPAARRTPR